jgi:glycine/serine hydroxymethyltransferase
MGAAEMDSISKLMDTVLREVEIRSGSEYNIKESFVKQTTGQVKDLCSRFPIR